MCIQEETLSQKQHILKLIKKDFQTIESASIQTHCFKSGKEVGRRRTCLEPRTQGARRRQWCLCNFTPAKPVACMLQSQSKKCGLFSSVGEPDSSVVRQIFTYWTNPLKLSEHQQTVAKKSRLQTLTLTGSLRDDWAHLWSYFPYRNDLVWLTRAISPNRKGLLSTLGQRKLLNFFHVMDFTSLLSVS